MISSADQERTVSYARIAIIVIAVIQGVGLIGLNSAHYHSDFEQATSGNLLLSFLLVMGFARPLDYRLLVFCGFAFSVGMVAEIVGVHTGIPFGRYYYTDLLGAKLIQVPVIIGINWLLLTYAIGVTMSRHFREGWWQVVAAAAIMTGLDMLLERFAIAHHLWVWQDGVPPVQNYLSWFVISLVIEAVLLLWVRPVRNAVAAFYLLILVLFLAADLAIRTF